MTAKREVMASLTGRTTISGPAKGSAVHRDTSVMPTPAATSAHAMDRARRLQHHVRCHSKDRERIVDLVAHDSCVATAGSSARRPDPAARSASCPARRCPAGITAIDCTGSSGSISMAGLRQRQFDDTDVELPRGHQLGDLPRRQALNEHRDLGPRGQKAARSPCGTSHCASAGSVATRNAPARWKRMSCATWAMRSMPL